MIESVRDAPQTSLSSLRSTRCDHGACSPTARRGRRLSGLRALDVLDTPPEAEFDALVRAASMVCGTPISLVSLIDSERQWIKANVGLPDLTETPREVAFCAHAIMQDDILEISDARLTIALSTIPWSPRTRIFASTPARR